MHARPPTQGAITIVHADRYPNPAHYPGAQLVPTMSTLTRGLGFTTRQVVAEHVLVPLGEASVHDEHYGDPRPTAPRRAVLPKTTAEKEFCALGPVAEAFVTGAAAAGAPEPRTER